MITSINEFRSAIIEKVNIPNTVYHGTSLKLKEKMESTKMLFATLGYIGYGFYVTPNEKEALYWAKNYYWKYIEGGTIYSLTDLTDSEAASNKYKNKIVPIGVLNLKISSDAKIYNLGTFYGGGSWMNHKQIGSKKFLALIEEVKKLYPTKDYRVAITEHLRKLGYDAIYSKSNYYVSGGDQLCIINDRILNGYTIIENPKLKGTENMYGRSKETALLKF